MRSKRRKPKPGGFDGSRLDDEKRVERKVSGQWRFGQRSNRAFGRQVDADLTEAKAQEALDQQVHDPAHNQQTYDLETTGQQADSNISTEFSGADFPDIDTEVISRTTQPTVTHAIVRERAVRLLVNREHGRLELEQKLLQRELPPDLIDSVLDQLAEEGLQCDARFAESYTRMRIDRGYGPNKVRADLQTRRLDQSFIEDAIRDSGADWRNIACAALAKKFGGLSTLDTKARAKMQRYLYQRGFELEEIRFALDDFKAADCGF